MAEQERKGSKISFSILAMRNKHGLLSILCVLLLLLWLHTIISTDSALFPWLPLFDSCDGVSEPPLTANHGLRRISPNPHDSPRSSRTTVSIAFGLDDGNDGTKLYVEIPLKKMVTAGKLSPV